MNDEELRAFLESATVGGPEPEPEPEPQKGAPRQTAAAVPPVVPPAPVVPPSRPGQQPLGPSFDELIGLRRQQAAEQDPVPLVLPEPSKPHAAEPGLTPLQLPVPPASPPPFDPQPPTQPLARTELPDSPVPASRAATSQPVVPSAAPVTATTPLLNAPADPLFGLIPPAGGGDDYEKIAVTGGSDRKKLLPWIIVGAGAAIALVASIAIINAVTGGAASDAAPAPAPTETTAAPSTPSTSPTPSPIPEEPTADQPPQVDVGQTMALDVPFWNITADLSTRFGQTSYVIDGGSRLVLTSALIDSLPQSCAAMRSEWGILRTGDASFEVLKPAQRCADAPELYDELWGLSAAMVDSIRPLQ